MRIYDRNRYHHKMEEFRVKYNIYVQLDSSKREDAIRKKVAKIAQKRFGW